MKRTFYLIIILFNILTLSGKNVYVSQKGSDDNDGSINRPYKTIQRAIDEIKSSKGESTIFLREGKYSLNRSLKVENLKNISITAYKNEKVSITGGISINKKNIEKVNDKKELARFKTKNLWVIDFNKLKLNLTGLSKRGFAYKTQPAWTELFIDEKPLEIARWPNESMILIESVINTGNIPSKNIKGKGKPVISFKESEPRKWKTVNGGWICGYFGEGWADDMLPIESIDKKNNTLTIASSSEYGFKADGQYRRWYVRNIAEALDKPGECFMDEKESKVFFSPLDNDFNQIEISVLEEPIIYVASCTDVIIKNITIECSRGTGIQVSQSNNIKIDSCIFRNLGNLGVKIDASCNNSGIENSYVYQTGSGGIELNGGDRKKLIPGNNYARNCRIHDFNRLERSYRPGIYLKGAGNKVSNVEIYNAPSMAIYIKGNNHKIEYADIHHVCEEVYDQGAIYYGRNPTERGHSISYSYFHDIQSTYAVTAIYHDDGACGMKVHGCIFNNISSAPVLIGGGQDITYTNNLFMNLPYAIQIDNRLQKWQSYAKWLEPDGEYDKKFKEVNYTQPPYSKAYPELIGYWKNHPEIPQRNMIKNNLFFKVDKLIKGESAFLILKENLQTKSNPGLVDEKDPIKGWKDYNIKKTAPFFTGIPTSKIGCDLPILKQ